MKIASKLAVYLYVVIGIALLTFFVRLKIVIPISENYGSVGYEFVAIAVPFFVTYIILFPIIAINKELPTIKERYFMAIPPVLALSFIHGTLELGHMLPKSTTYIFGYYAVSILFEFIPVWLAMSVLAPKLYSRFLGMSNQRPWRQ
jgi:hypothetical protein